MTEAVPIELSENVLEELELIARWKSGQEGKEISVEDLIQIAVERHLDRLSQELGITK